jgi:hypothetical protein
MAKFLLSFSFCLTRYFATQRRNNPKKERKFFKNAKKKKLSVLIFSFFTTIEQECCLITKHSLEIKKGKSFSKKGNVFVIQKKIKSGKKAPISFVLILFCFRFSLWRNSRLQIK